MCSVHSLLTSVPRLILLRSCWVPDRHILVHWHKGSFCHVYGVNEQVWSSATRTDFICHILIMKVFPTSNLRRNKIFLTFTIVQFMKQLPSFHLYSFNCFNVTRYFLYLIAVHNKTYFVRSRSQDKLKDF